MANFTFHNTELPGVVLIEPRRYDDPRGFFMESYHRNAFHDAGITDDFVQDNQSVSAKGVLRGMHFQTEHAQSKLIRVGHGAIFDVAVDLRKGSPTWGKWYGTELTAENRRMLYIPKGFAHGFLSLMDQSMVLYKAGDLYSPKYDSGIRFDDPAVGIEWPDIGMSYLLSEKDLALNAISEMTGRE